MKRINNNMSVCRNITGNLLLRCMAGLFLVTIAILFVFRDRDAPQQRKEIINIDLHAIQEMHAARILSRNQQKLSLKLMLRQNPYIIIKIPKKIYHKKLHLRLGKLEHISMIYVYPIFKGEHLNGDDVIFVPIGKAGGIRHEYNIILPDGDYEALRIDFKSGLLVGLVELLGMSLHPVKFADWSLWNYLLAFLVGAYILLPGLLLFPLVHREKKDIGEFLSVFIGYSVLYYVLLYLAWIAIYRFKPQAADMAVLMIAIISLVFLVWLNKSKEHGVAYYAARSFKEITIYFMLLMICCFILMRHNNLPIENTWYSTIASRVHLLSKTYHAFGAHDAVFHYVNGIAISNDEPFSKYYAHGALLYNVEDRGILPGILYSSLRCLIRNISSTLADSYFIYTLIGASFNLMVIFPVITFYRKYGKSLHLFFFISAFTLNTFILVNFYLTWFKMAGAAFFLSGLYMMLLAVENAQTVEWMKSGLLLGIGSSMHAGSALGIPLFFLWSIRQNIKRKTEVVQALIKPILLVIVFAVVNFPWALIKKLYLHDNYRLLKEHFLNNYSDPAGLKKSIMLFWMNVPLADQIQHRFQRLWEAFRFEQIKELFLLVIHGKYGTFFRLWNSYEFTYSAFALYPYIILGLSAWTVEQWRAKKIQNIAQDYQAQSPVRALSCLSILTILIIIFFSYGPHAPDITYHQPMGVIVLLIVLMISYVDRVGGWVKLAGYMYIACTTYRMITYFN